MSSVPSMDEKKLDKLAVEEFLKDLKRGAERAKEFGALGWLKNPAPPPNKRFLNNMVVSTFQGNRSLNHRQRDASSHHPDRESDHHKSLKRDSGNERYQHKNRYKSDSYSGAHSGERYSDKKTQKLSPEPENDTKKESRSDRNQQIQHSCKRHRSTSSDLEKDDRNGSAKHRKRTHKKHHKRRSDQHIAAKKKYKSK